MKSLKFIRSHQLLLPSVAVLSVVILVTYFPALKLGFYGDDYSFVEFAGRSSLSQYLAFYFDPRIQTAWYRPIQGMLFGIEYVLFGANPQGYHLINVLVHLGNCLLLFALVGQMSGNLRAALMTALLYAGLPLYGVSVFWPGDADFLVAFFYLLAIFSWTLFLQEGGWRFYASTICFFIVALMTKEFGVTIPIALFLIDRLLVHAKTDLSALVRRYLPFILVWAIYLPMEYWIQSRSVLTNQFGYSVGSHALANVVGYLAALAFPWGFPEPANYVWLVIVIILCAYVIASKRNAALPGLVSLSVLAFLPVTPFPWFLLRYLYLAVMIFAIFFAVLLERVWVIFKPGKWVSRGALAAFALIIFGNGLGVADAAADFAELARQTRVPFRDIAQRHATLPEDTYLYFVDPPSPTSQYSGMFFLRYGPRISVASNAVDVQANLRGHRTSYIIYFDEQQRTRELSVDPSLSVRTDPSPPVNFDEPIRLEGFELASTKAKRGEATALILYWRVMGKTERAFTVFLHLVDAASGNRMAGYDGPPRAQVANTTWIPNVSIVDAKVLPIPMDAPIGNNYQLEIGLYDSSTMQRLLILDAQGQPITDKVVIGPISIVE